MLDSRRWKHRATIIGPSGTFLLWRRSARRASCIPEGNFPPARETRPWNRTPDLHFTQYSCGFFALGNEPRDHPSDHRTYTVVPCLANS